MNLVSWGLQYLSPDLRGAASICYCTWSQYRSWWISPWYFCIYFRSLSGYSLSWLFDLLGIPGREKCDWLWSPSSPFHISTEHPGLLGVGKGPCLLPVKRMSSMTIQVINCNSQGCQKHGWDCWYFKVQGIKQLAFDLEVLANGFYVQKLSCSSRLRAVSDFPVSSFMACELPRTGWGASLQAALSRLSPSAQRAPGGLWKWYVPVER